MLECVARLTPIKIMEHVIMTTNKGNVLPDQPKKRCWHCLLARALKELLNPVNIQVLTEVQILSDPPKADIILLRREGKTWTKEQRDCLADGLRDTDAERVLIEFKYTESITDHTFEKLFFYHYLYRESEKLKQDQLQSFLVSAKTPGTKILTEQGFEPAGQQGVYASTLSCMRAIRVILLNEIENKLFDRKVKKEVKKEVKPTCYRASYNTALVIYLPGLVIKSLRLICLPWKHGAYG